MKAFCGVFSRVPKERGLGLDDISYEEFGDLYHAGGAYRFVLLSLVRKINAGRLHESAAAMLGENVLYALTAVAAMRGGG